MPTSVNWAQRAAAFAWRQWPLLSVLALVVVSLVFIAVDRFRVGSVLMAMTMVYAFLLRLSLPDDAAGLLVVRRKSVDIVVLGILALGLVVLSLWVPSPS